MTSLRAKKNLGQHFLKDKNIALKIVDSLQANNIEKVLEIGPGMGVLTQFLIQKKHYETTVVEIDRESVEYLKTHFPDLNGLILSEDFLKMDVSSFSDQPFGIIGNFPYNISSQIFFKILENRNQVPEVVGMIQKEVAERLCVGPGSKTYGILSVLLQAFYHVEYLFTVNEQVFIPPPKVKSAVIRLIRNERIQLECDENLFFKLVKTSFNQRRKTLRNSLKVFLNDPKLKEEEIFSKRPEQLRVNDFERLTRLIEKQPQN